MRLSPCKNSWNVTDGLTHLLFMQLPGADAGKPDVKGAAEKAVKKSPLGFMNVGELAFDLPGSGVSKDDLPNNVKPGDAAGLPKGPTAKPPTLPSLPKVPACTRVIMWVLVDMQMWHVFSVAKELYWQVVITVCLHHPFSPTGDDRCVLLLPC